MYTEKFSIFDVYFCLNSRKIVGWLWFYTDVFWKESVWKQAEIREVPHTEILSLLKTWKTLAIHFWIKSIRVLDANIILILILTLVSGHISPLKLYRQVNMHRLSMEHTILVASLSVVSHQRPVLRTWEVSSLHMAMLLRRRLFSIMAVTPRGSDSSLSLIPKRYESLAHLLFY